MTPSQQAARIAHDVGKYVARAARNLRERDVAAGSALHKMLLDDLYRAPARASASQAFTTLCADPSLASSSHPELVEATRLFARIDALQDAVTAAEPLAIAEVVTLAIEVSDLLHAFAHRLHDERSP